MSILFRITSSIVGLLHGTQARQKFIFLRQTKKQERRLKNFWQKNGLTDLDEMEIKSWHSHQ